jgi:SAM-dependent methyltransferase
MNPAEYEVLASVEDRHWWYRGLRDAVSCCLSRPDLRLPPHPRILDAGCGTGANLRFLAELLEPSYHGAFDAAPEALRLSALKAPPGVDLYASDIRDPILRAGDLDLVISTDVIYIPGAEASMNGIRRLAGALRGGGMLILNLPAYDWLYSEHDVAVHTRERFTARTTRAVLEGAGLRVARLSYRLCLLFPVVALARVPSMIRARRGMTSARSDLHDVPGERVSRMLLALLQVENRLVARGARLPWGSSVFAIGRKP